MLRLPVFDSSPFRIFGFTVVLVASFSKASAVDGSPRDPLNPSSTPQSAGEVANPFTLPEVVVTETALRVEEDVWSIPQAITIVDRGEIERRQARTPTEMLKEQPGIWAVSVAAQGSPIIRGQIGNRVLYLWDGVRINNGALFGGPNGFFNQFPIGAVDHIEVIRGSGSVQYGSDAIGGVINVFSKKGEFTEEFDIGGDIYGRFGSNDRETTEIMDLHISNQRFALAAGITRQDVGDYYGPGEGKIRPTGFQAFGGYANVAFRPFENHTIRLSWIGNERTNVDSYVQSKLNPNGIQRFVNPLERRGILKLDYTALELGSWSDELKFYGYYQYYDQLRERRDDKISTFNTTFTDTNQDILGFGLQNANTWGKARFIYGVDYRREKLQSSLRLRSDDHATGDVLRSEPAGNTPDGTYEVFDAFATVEFRPFEKLLLTAGLRFENTGVDSAPVELDVIPDAGYTRDILNLDKSWQSLTWNVGAIYSVTKEWDLVANVGSAFRAPTYSDLFSAGTPVFSSKIASVPNPVLDPEQSITYEIGTRYHSEKFAGTLTAYWTQLDDLIVQTQSGTVVIPSQGTFAATRRSNSGEGYVTGIELAGAYKPAPDWTIFGNATYTYGQNTTLDDPLRFIPPLNGTFGIRYESPSRRWWVEVTEDWAARLTRHALDDEGDAGFARDPGLGSPNTTDNKPLRDNFDIPGYWITNLRAGATVWQRGDQSLELTLSLRNLFNTSYREAYSQQQIVAPGFGAVIGARLTFF